MEDGQNLKFEIHDLDLFYGDFQALQKVTIDIRENQICALIGPSGCGKSTFLRVLNRLNDLIEGVTIRGEVFFDGFDVYGGRYDVIELRKRVGMVFQKPNAFPMSVYDNVAFGPRVHGMARRSDIDEVVERSLRQAVLWEEVKDRLHAPALSLSGGQQQRLCIARAISVEPEVILMDEPTSSLDPISTGGIEDLVVELKKSYTIVIVTHNMQQAGRFADRAGFFLNGELVEEGDTKDIFFSPQDGRTQDYISGRFG